MSAGAFPPAGPALPERYVILEELGAGAMARVLRARDGKLGREVALKVVHDHLLRDGTIRERFLKEAKAFASLSHENIVGLYDVEEKTPFLVMECVRGRSLEALFAAEGRLPALVALELARQLFAGLSAAHATGIVHRDVKPANLLLDAGGCLKIADFGIAHLLNQDLLTADGQFLGTPQYSSPEAVRGEKVTDRSDIFSAGCVIYRGLAGRPPFQGANPHQTLRVLSESEPDPLGELRPELPPFIVDLVTKCLGKTPGLRPAAVDMSASIEDFVMEGRFRLGKSRIKAFLADARACRDEEKKALAGYLLETARFQEARGEHVKAQRSFYRASLLGAAVPGPEGRAGEVGGKPADGSTAGPRTRRRALRRWVAVLAALGVVLAALVLLPREISPPERRLGEGGDGDFPAEAVGGHLSDKPDYATPAHPEPPGVANRPPKDRGEGVPLPAPGQSDVLAVSASAPGRAAEDFPAGGKTPAGRAVRAPEGGRVDRVPEAGRPARTPKGAGASKPASGSAPPTDSEPGYLSIKSRPPFARVFLDETDIGHTPFKAPRDWPAGEYRLRLEKENCRTVTRRIRIAQRETLYLAIELPRNE